jgi:solute carrier family 25 phosphate transporter 23/24/25/41
MDYRNLLAGAGSGLITKTVNAPLERIKILYQIQDIRNPNKYGSFINTVKIILKEEGVFGLYKGNWVNSLRVMPAYALKFTFSEYFRKILPNNTVTDKMKIGALTGVSQISLTHPLDLLRTRYSMAETKGSILKYTANIIKNEGFSGMYKGISVSLITGSVHISLQLTFFDVYKSLIHKHTRFDNTATKLVGGALAGITSMALTYPGDIVKKHMHSNGILKEKRIYNNTWDCCKKIWKKEGVVGFFKGIKISTFKTMPSAAIQFASYDYLRGLYKEKDL